MSVFTFYLSFLALIACSKPNICAVALEIWHVLFNISYWTASRVSTALHLHTFDDSASLLPLSLSFLTRNICNFHCNVCKQKEKRLHVLRIFIPFRSIINVRTKGALGSMRTKKSPTDGGTYQQPPLTFNTNVNLCDKLQRHYVQGRKKSKARKKQVVLCQ